MYGYIVDILKIVSRRSLLAILASSLIITALEVGSVSAAIPAVSAIVSGKVPEVFNRLFSGIGVQSPNSQKLALLVAIAAIFLIRGVFLSAIIFVQSRIVFNTQRNLSNILFERFLSAKFERVVDVPSSTMVRSTTTELANITNGILLSFSVLVSEIAMVSGVLLVLFFLQPVVAFVLLISMLALIWPLIALNRKHLSRLGKLRLEMEEGRVQLAQEVVAGIREIKVYALERQLRDSIDDTNRIYSRILTRVGFIQIFPRIYFETVGILALLLICAGQLFLGKSSDEIMMFLAVSGLAAFRALPSMAKCLAQIQAIRFYRPSLIGILGLMDKLAHEAVGKDVLSGGSTVPETPASPRQLCVTMDNASYRHEIDGSNIFTNVNLSLRSGEVVGLIGPSGIGKSTLLDCLIGLRKLTQGSVGVLDCSTGAPMELRISYVPQAPVILGGTIWRNITLTNDDISASHVGDTKLDRALQISGMGDMMTSRGLTLSSMVVEGGRNFSGGQRQRLALVRALYRDADLLVLDESTSALDKQSEQDIIKNIRNYYSDRLVIIVTHRSELLSLCDKIISMEPAGIVNILFSGNSEVALNNAPV